MKTLEQLLAMIALGQPVILNGQHLTTATQVEAAYPEAREAHESAQSASPQTLLAGIAELKQHEPAVTRSDLDALHDRIVGAMVPRSEHEALQARIASEFVPIADANTLVSRNVQQADLIAALTKTPESLALLDDAGIAAVANFEGAKLGKSKDETLKAILAKRGS